MRSFVFTAAAIILAIGHSSGQAAPSPDVSHYMVIIVTSTSGSVDGVRMTTLSFPSERACTAAAAIFAQPFTGANIVARCAPVK